MTARGDSGTGRPRRAGQRGQRRHGGVVFALADQAFAAAALTVLGAAVTSDAAIQYVGPSGGGSVLVAQARTSYHDERRAVIDVDVVADGRTVAIYRGTARALRKSS